MSKKESELDKKYFIKESTETKNFLYQEVKGKKTVMFGRVHRHSNYRTYQSIKMGSNAKHLFSINKDRMLNRNLSIDKERYVGI